jgi:hypothetical protein
MLNMLNKKKAQNTAEYAILIALVVGGVIAMQTYAQRALQGRIRDANVTMRDQSNALGNTLQYEPYYQDTSATSSRKSSKATYAGGGNESTNVIKDSGAKDNTTYNATTVTAGGTAEERAAGY